MSYEDDLHVVWSIIKNRLDAIPTSTSGVSSDHEAGYYDGKETAYQDVLDILRSETTVLYPD